MAKGLQSEIGFKRPSKPQTTQAQTPVRVPPALIKETAPGWETDEHQSEKAESGKIVIKSPIDVLIRIVFRVMLIPVQLVPLVMPGILSNAGQDCQCTPSMEWRMTLNPWPLESWARVPTAQMLVGDSSKMSVISFTFAPTPVGS